MIEADHSWTGGMRRQKHELDQAGLAVGGFTLVEIAIVLVVIGVLLAATLSGIGPVLESSKRNQTNRKLDRIELALLAYVIENGCLPCPADGTQLSSSSSAGWSVASTGTTPYYGPNGPNNQPCAGTSSSCASTRGVVPWNTLGLKEGDTEDAWSDRITYAVDPTLVATAQTSMVRTLPAIYPAGSLTVSNNGSPTSVQQTGAAAYVLVSHGPDRVFAYAAGSGKQNVDGTGNYTTGTAQCINSPSNLGSCNDGGTSFRQDQPYLQQGSKYFDDIVRYRTAPAIIVDCGPNACGNPAS